VDFKDSLGDFQKPKENEDKQTTRSYLINDFGASKLFIFNNF